MDSLASAELSKSAKRRQRAKAAEAAKAEAEAPPPAPAPAAKAKGKAEPKPASKPAAKPAAKAASSPAAEAKPKQQASPAAKPKAEPKQAAAKSKAAAKAGAQKPARKQSEEPVRKESGVAPVELDDGSGGGWEVSTGLNKKVAAKAQRKKEEQAEIDKLKAAHGYPTTTKSGAPQPHIPGMAPSSMKGGPTVSQAVGATGAGAAAIAAAAAAGAAVAAKHGADAEASAVKSKEPSSIAQIKVPEAKIGRVIGPRGANIKLITEKTGCDRVDTSGDMVTITGPPHAVSQAEHAIRELMDKGYMSMAFDNFTEFAIHVHPSVFPDLIGKQGAIIKAIKETLNVEIEIPAVPKDATTKNKKYPLKIAGAAEDVEKAKTVVNDIVMYSHHEITHPGMAHEELEIASWQYSFIIGKAGSELRHIQNNFKVKVSIPREHSANQKVLVVGEPQDVTRAKTYIEKVIWNAQNNTSSRTDVSAADDWGDEEHESWMDAYMYKRR